MNTAPVIAILGLSGSGKSYLARIIARSRPDMLRIQAGALLRRTFHTTGEKLRTAQSDDVRENQFELANALLNERDGQFGRPVLLEAHAFIDNDRELVDVPMAVMASLDLAGIILVDAPATTVLKRRTVDTRVRPRRSLVKLRQQRRRLRELAELYASTLDIPLIRIDSGDRENALVFVDTIIAQSSPPTQ